MTTRRFKINPMPLAALLAALSTAPANASDRPYQATSSAAAEEDDDGVWSVESWAQRLGPVRAWSIAPEYAFNPTTSLQLEFTRQRDRALGETASLGEIEFKHLFNHIARDGWGWGVVGTVGFARTAGQSWRRDEWGLKIPFTVALWDGEGLVHLNAGLTKPAQARREWNFSVALERELGRRTTVFGELARAGESKLAHAGIRWWVKREKFALDIAVQRALGDGVRESGLVIGLGWYDL